jgi:hypothetical protein
MACYDGGVVGGVDACNWVPIGSEAIDELFLYGKAGDYGSLLNDVSHVSKCFFGGYFEWAVGSGPNEFIIVGEDGRDIKGIGILSGKFALS